MKKSVKVGLAVLGVFAVLAAVTPEEKAATEQQAVNNQTEVGSAYKGTLDDLKKYAAQYFECKPESIMVYTKEETSQSIEVECALSGSTEKHLVIYDYNEDGPIGITIDLSYFFINNGKLTKNFN